MENNIQSCTLSILLQNTMYMPYEKYFFYNDY